MKKIILTFSLITMTASPFVSCNSEEALVQQQQPQTAAVYDKSPEMIRFERSLAGMGAKWSSIDSRVSGEAKIKVKESAITYLNAYGRNVKENLTPEEILSTAFKLHAENLKNSRINKEN